MAHQTNREHPAAQADIAVILVGLNARDYIKQCLRSIYAADWHQYSYVVVYVDNGSIDDSVSMVRTEFPHVVVHENRENLGYCPAANQGAALVDCPYLMFVNDDTIILEDAISKLADLLASNTGVASVGARLLYQNMSEQWSGRSFPSAINALFGRRSLLHRLVPDSAPLVRYLHKADLDAGRHFRVDWVSAAAVMFRGSDFWSVGGFAEDYYYWHEAVIAKRLLDKGRLTYLHPGARIIHFEGKGSGARSYAVRKFHIINFHEGAFRFYCEHHRLGLLHPLCWLAAIGLSCRALILLTLSRFSHQS